MTGAAPVIKPRLRGVSHQWAFFVSLVTGAALVIAAPSGRATVAAAVYSVSVLPSERYPRGLGLSFKMEDGSYRGLAPAVVETLLQIGVLDETEAAQLITYYRPVIENRRGLHVGEVRAIFNLRFNQQ